MVICPANPKHKQRHDNRKGEKWLVLLELIFKDKRVVVSLTYVYGIGLPTSKKILAATVSEVIRVKDLTSDQEDAIRREVDAIVKS